MAESKHYSKDLTECGICLSTVEEPKTLPCLHSYCLTCLNESASTGKKDEVRCPLCVQDFPLPKDGMKGFKTNFFINTLKERRATATKLQAKDAVIPCNCCGAVDHKAEAYCTSCGGFVCGECVGIHRKLKHMSSHKLTPFEDLRSGKVDIRSLSQHKFCKIHEGQVLWFCCETCGVLICRDCTVVDHPASTHTLVNMESATKGQKEEIEKLIQDCGKVQESVADALQEMEVVLKNLSRNATKTDAQINDAFDRYRETFLKQLEQKRKAIKSEVNQAMSQSRKQVDAQKDEIHLQQTRLHIALQMASEVTNTGSDYDLAVAYTSLESNLTQLRDMTLAPVQRHLGELKFKEVSEPELPSLGTLLLNEWKFVKEFGKLSDGHGVAVTPAGDIAVADSREIGIYDKNGYHKLSFNLTDCGQLIYAWEVLCSNHQIFVTDCSAFINVYDDMGKFLFQFNTKAPSNVSSDAQSRKHMGLAMDNQGHLLVAECNQKYISKHELNGTHITSFKVNIVVHFMAVNKHNKIIITSNSWDKPAVQILDHNGLILYNLKSPTTRGWNPYGLCCPTADEIFISSNSKSKGIYCFSSESGEYLGCITREVDKPAGLALTDDGKRLIVAENGSVKVFNL